MVMFPWPRFLFHSPSGNALSLTALHRGAGSHWVVMLRVECGVCGAVAAPLCPLCCVLVPSVPRTHVHLCLPCIVLVPTMPSHGTWDGTVYGLGHVEALGGQYLEWDMQWGGTGCALDMKCV